MLHQSSFNYFFSLLNVDYVKLNSNWNFDNIVSPYYRIYYIDDGYGIISGLTDHLVLEPGYIYIIPSFTVCNLRCPEYLSQYFIQFFEESANGISLFHNKRKILKINATERDINNFKRILEINPGRGINRSDDPKVYEKQTYYREYQSLNQVTNSSLKFENQGILLQLISRFLDNSTKLTKNQEIPSKILDSMNYIELNLHTSINISDLSNRVNQNKDYFSRIFFKHVGLRPLKYVHEKRIERAQYLITTTNKTFDEISAETGFSNISHFSNIFKKNVGLTPGQYRNQILKLI